MAKFRDRTCKTCGGVEYTASQSDLCLSCYWENRSTRKIAAEKQRVLDCYGNVEGPSIDKFNHRCYTFTHSCGTQQTWAFTNLIKQWKTKSEPCSKCGSTERIKPAMKGYIEKYGLDEKARTDLRAYTRKVRGLSEKTYRDNIDIINPARHPRMLGNQGYHLDHIVSIVECFRQGWSPEKAAALDNLQLLEARDNLSKGRSVA